LPGWVFARRHEGISSDAIAHGKMSLTGKFAFLYVDHDQKRFPVDSAVQFQPVLWGNRFASGKSEIRRMTEKEMPLNNIQLPIDGARS
jgi:hypothetical protein